MDTLPRRFGPFLLLKSLGSGATGDVFLARPLDRERGWPTHLVVKRMHSTMTAQPEQQARFHHEARLGQALDTPHVPRVHAVDDAEGTPYIAMDFVPGWTLARIMKTGQPRHASSGSLVDIVRDVLTGLIALHEAVDPRTGRPLGALHRDLAPKNLMLGEDGVTRIIDFGLGKSTVQDWQTSTGVIMGTPGYMAPEQVIASEMDVRADLYAVGVVLWELLGGEPYIGRGPVHKMLREQLQMDFRPLPDRRTDAFGDYAPVLMGALAADAAERFGTARAFLAALEELTADWPRGDGPVSELITEPLWDELAASQEELNDLTQAFEPVRLSDFETTDELDGSEAPTTGGPVIEPGGPPVRVEAAPFDLGPTTAESDVLYEDPTFEAPHVQRVDPAFDRRPRPIDEPSRSPPPVHVDASAPTVPASAGYDFRPRPDRRLLFALALLSVAAVIGVGLSLAFRFLDEEPAPEFVEPFVRPVPASPEPKATPAATNTKPSRER